MQRMQRKFGAFLPRTADNAEVGTLISEFNEADKALENLIQASKHWRDAWSDILRFQFNISHEYDALYKPILATSEHTDVAGPRHVPVETPQAYLRKVEDLDHEYNQLRNDMLEEVRSMDERIIRPAEDARHGIVPMKKTIKRREDRKLDYERYQSRVDAIDKKYKRSDRETAALNKHQGDLERAVVEYRNADDVLRECLPPLVNALLSIFPYLLEAQIQIQNTLLAQCYTSLHTYCQAHGFPFPAAEVEDIVAQWEADWKPTCKELEGQFKMLAVGKVIREPIGSERGKSYSGLNIRNNIKDRKGSAPAAAAPQQERPKIQSRPSGPARNGSAHPPAASPQLALDSKPRLGSYSSHSSLAPHAPSDGIIRVASGNSLARSYSGTSNGEEEYFAHARPTGTANPYSSTPITPGGASAAGMAAAAAAAKKKPPPPPPPKRLPSHQGTFVTALYDFDGESGGDLSFREGDRIRVMKKTESEQDWWEGELKGRRGAFPANYCKIEA